MGNSDCKTINVQLPYISAQYCPVKEVKRIGLNPSFCYNGFACNTLLSKGDSSHGPL